MKKIAIILGFFVIISSLASCGKIEKVNVVQETSQTLQVENPPQELTTTKETTPASATETVTTTPAVTTSTATSASTVTTVNTTAAKTSVKQPVTTSAQKTTTVHTTTTTPKVTTTVPATTSTAPAATTKTITNSTYNAINFAEQKAMWISYLEFQSILKGKTQAQFKASVQSMYNNCKSMGINTVYVHARSHSDAFYVSDLYPWSLNCTGTIDVSPGFDPFKILVDEAHSRGLSIHAWINPMRGLTDADMQKISNKYQIKQWYNDPAKRGTYIVSVDGTWYCSPAYKEVRNLITNGAKEIVSKYNVDGIHIDDYFYPTTATSFDTMAFSQSGSNNLSQWRLDTISSMVRELYAGIKSVNPTVLFGVSPQGNISNDYSTQYADVKKWCANQGYLDYIVPQIYYGFKNTSQPYATNLQSWCNLVTAPNVKLVAGLAPYKIGSVESTGEWENDTRIMARQVETFKAQPKYGGAAFFRYGSMFWPSAYIQPQMSKEIEELTAVLK